MKGVLSFARGIAVALVVFLPASFMVKGCGKAGELCDLRCECNQCSDRAYDDCIIGVNREAEVAADYDCSLEADNLQQCQIDNLDCDEKTNAITYDGECDKDQAEYFECIADESDLQGPLPGSSGQNAAQQAANAVSAAVTAASTTTTSSNATTSSSSGGGGACCECSCTMMCALGDPFQMPCSDCDCNIVCDDTCSGGGCGSAFSALFKESC